MRTVLQKLFPALIFSFIVSFSFAQAGTLDSSFGVNGKVITTFGTVGYATGKAEPVAIQQDEKIVVGGYVFHPVVGPDYFALARYLPNGKPDSSFGINGKSKEFIGPFPKENEIYSLAQQSDGKILAGGYSDGYCVVRYKTSGFIDSSFGINGIVRTPDPSFCNAVSSVNMLKDGKIIAGATT